MSTKVVIDCSGKLPEKDRVQLVPMTDAELAQAEIDRPEAERVQAIMRRAERDGLLAASDWTQMPDVQLSAAKKAAWKKYRQELRDNPTGPWPERP